MRRSMAGGVANPLPRRSRAVSLAGPAHRASVISRVSRHTVAALSLSEPLAADEEDRSIDRTLLASCYAVFATMYMNMSLVAPFVPRAAAEWGISPAQVGVLVGCDPIGELLSAALVTWIVARLGVCRASMFGVIGNAVSSIIFGLAPLLTTNPRVLFPVFVVMRLVNGAATNVSFVAIFTLLCCLMPHKIGSVTANSQVPLRPFCVLSWGSDEVGD
jgi:hypothetical protein